MLVYRKREDHFYKKNNTVVFDKLKRNLRDDKMKKTLNVIILWDMKIYANT